MLSRRETILALGATAAFSLTKAARGQAAAAHTPSLDEVDPELRAAAIRLQSLMATMPGYDVKGLAQLRASSGKWSQPPIASVPWEKRVVAGKRGNPDVTVYVINSRPGRERGAILYIHGGGFVSGAAHLEISRSQELAAALDCTIVSVEYRLAPETRYAGSLEDNYAALLWLYQNAAQLGVDPRRIAVLGESAGGGHAALLAIAARDRGEVPLAFQSLVYPMLDDRTGTTRRVPPTIGKYLWKPKSNAFGWQCFLGRSPGGANRAGVPGREPNLAGLPPTWIGVGAIDLFVQEDVSFADRLLSAGVPTELLVMPGAFHGFDLIGANSSVAKRFTAAKIEALRRALTF